MAKKRISRRVRGMTLPVAVLAGFAPLIGDTIYHVQHSGGVGTVPHTLAWHLAGINTWDNNQFDFGRLLKGWAPIVGGVVLHKVANRLGINRALAGAGIPFIRI